MSSKWTERNEKLKVETCDNDETNVHGFNNYLCLLPYDSGAGYKLSHYITNFLVKSFLAEISTANYT